MLKVDRINLFLDKNKRDNAFLLKAKTDIKMNEEGAIWDFFVSQEP